MYRQARLLLRIHQKVLDGQDQRLLLDAEYMHHRKNQGLLRHGWRPKGHLLG